MYVELPEFKRCCMCIPLRYGLLSWGYLKLIITVLLMVFLTAIFIADPHDTSGIIIASLLFVAVAIGIAFNIVFVVGAHKKSQRLLKVYFYYSIVGIALFSILSLIKLGFDIYTFISFYRYFIGAYHLLMVGMTATSFFLLLLEFYVILLVRSEIRKLDNCHEFEFVNIAAEAVCKLKTDKEMPLPELIANID